MIVGVPSGTCAISQRPSASVSRTQPWLTGRPIVEVSGVEWIAIRLPPVHPWIACGDVADSARMQHP